MPLPTLPPLACCRLHSPRQHQALRVSHAQAVKHMGGKVTRLARGSEYHWCWQLRRQHKEQSLLQSPDSHDRPRTFSSHSVNSASHNKRMHKALSARIHDMCHASLVHIPKAPETEQHVNEMDLPNTMRCREHRYDPHLPPGLRRR